ncbi:lysosome-associated membrane glycoprotein 1 [Apis cerana]|nr:lysosome-associated membrane glycoprotein 1 [Apis cerana]
MMSKFLLLLCFTAVHVLGEDQENILSKKNDALLTSPRTSLQNDSEHLKANILSNKNISLTDLGIISDTDENKIKSQEVTKNSFQTSTIISNHSTVMPLDMTAIPISTNETSKKISDITNPIVIHAPINSTLSSYLSSTGKWTVVNGTDQICIVVQMSVMFNISYVDVNNKTSFITFNIPTDNVTTKASGYCGKLEQNLTLEWSAKNITNGSMTLHFMRNATENDYSLYHLEVLLPASDFPSNLKLNGSVSLVHETPDFEVRLSNSYRCLKQQTLNLKQNNSNETSGYLIVSGLQFQAFKVDNSTVFGLAKDCAFDTPDVVPIAVGCALAGLVIIVLIAYLIGRRRNQAHGYLSM